MSKLTPRQVKAQETKEKLLETGLKLFHEKGFDHVTVDSIAKACNVSKGAFYTHFDSKYDIFLEKFKDIDNFYLSFVPSIPKDITASEKILLFYEGQLTYLRDELGKDLIRTVYASPLSLTITEDHYLASPQRNLYKIIHAFVEEGVESGEFKKDFPAEYISMLVTRCMRGTIYDWIIFGDKLDPVEEIERFTSTFLDGVRK
ncbi:TetR/AcrR family transcriptional regulator [Sporosarcina pasteurii]|uniref:Potential acrAB operon repressor n=1 Tax=Sporosarcina pasteurii TaxID=1474 RepID=A0A380BF61_SPOPA|nr:TetR/AcrR family transcriptional regulator [Sporosarcina pasteurii]MDS9472549.1 TetR/AcrR family transcriptional regulator [Sporosarcina pasteurii]QBQ06102.1 TetR/AcrR family transcriptional regulator [Sporosarcina pasteurii]SUI99434.1 Potential acrAB operon repressor [Sporosarcina pasteurii]